MIDSPAGDDLAELTSLSRSGRTYAPLREPAASLLSLSHVTLSKNSFLCRSRGVPRKRAQKYALSPTWQNIRRTFFNQNVDFNILSLNREPGNSAHIIYNKEHENKRKTKKQKQKTYQKGERKLHIHQITHDIITYK